MDQDQETPTFTPAFPNLEIILAMGKEMKAFTSEPSFFPIVRVLGKQICEATGLPHTSRGVSALILAGYYSAALGVSDFPEIVGAVPDAGPLEPGTYETFDFGTGIEAWEIVGILHGVIGIDVPVETPMFVRTFDVSHEETREKILAGFELGKCISEYTRPHPSGMWKRPVPPAGYEMELEELMILLKGDSLIVFDYEQTGIEKIYTFIVSVINQTNFFAEFKGEEERNDLEIISTRLFPMWKQIDEAGKEWARPMIDLLSGMNAELDDLEEKIILLDTAEEMLPFHVDSTESGTISPSGYREMMDEVVQKTPGAVEYLRTLREEKKRERDNIERFFYKKWGNLCPFP